MDERFVFRGIHTLQGATLASIRDEPRLEGFEEAEIICLVFLEEIMGSSLVDSIH